MKRYTLHYIALQEKDLIDLRGAYRAVDQYQ